MVLEADRPHGEVEGNLLTSKLRPPRVRPGTSPRGLLIERLKAGPGPIVALTAPAGYGKTTLLAQWAERDTRPFAWVSVDEADNDPKRLLSYVVESLNEIEAIDRRVSDALASVGSSVLGAVVPRLCAALSSMTRPVVLVLDDVHLLRNVQCRAALSVLADHVPEDSALVLAGRVPPPVRVPRLRTEGRIVEISAADLALTVTEAGSLLHAAGVLVNDEDVAELQMRTEGWAAGLYLAALSLREGGSLRAAAASFGGDDRIVSEYVESEFLDRLPVAQRRFLARTSVLERMSGSLCDAVLEVTGSGATLRELAQSNMLLVPLDRREQWYRYHHLFRDMLRAELLRTEPDLVPVLLRRAAVWFEQHRMAEQALESSIRGGDADGVARLLQEVWNPLYRQGRTATLQRWFTWLDDRDGIDRYPVNAMNAAFLAAITGDAVGADRWGRKVDHWLHQVDRASADPYALALAATLRASFCRDGVEQMRLDADEAAALFDSVSFVPPVTPLLQGIARVLCGDLDGGDEFFAETLAMDSKLRAPDIISAVLCERALVALTRHRWADAEVFVGRARDSLENTPQEDSWAGAFTSAVQARVAQHHGDSATARRELVNALRLRPLLPYVRPHFAMQYRLTVIRVQMALGDLSGARTIMREIDAILGVRPDLGTLTDEALDLRARLAANRGPHGAGASSLTSAELRVLPLLTTHLTYQQIADELFLSKHTIHSQTKSLFRKLGVSSRSEAVARSRELALLEG